MTTPTQVPAISPILTVKGASDAIAFYAKAFGATENSRLPADDGKRLMHAAVSINGGTVMLCDEFPEWAQYGALPAPSTEKPAPVTVVVNYAAPDEVDTTWRRAMDAGCINVMQPSDGFWGARFATLTDPFGHRWMLHATLPKT